MFRHRVGTKPESISEVVAAAAIFIPVLALSLIHGVWEVAASTVSLMLMRVVFVRAKTRGDFRLRLLLVLMALLGLSVLLILRAVVRLFQNLQGSP